MGTCGQAVPGSTTTARATTAAATATKDIVCAACVAGSFGGNGDACTLCTAVDGDLSTADVTCTSASDSRTSACAATTTTKKNCRCRRCYGYLYRYLRCCWNLGQFKCLYRLYCCCGCIQCIMYFSHRQCSCLLYGWLL